MQSNYDRMPSLGDLYCMIERVFWAYAVMELILTNSKPSYL